MDFKHKNHLISTYLTFHKQVKEVKDTICDGNPPSRTDTMLTPLSKDLQEGIITRLEKIADLFEKIAQKYLSAELKKEKKRESMSATKMWASMQLRQIEEDLADIHPKNFGRKYGALDPEDQAYLEDIVNQILQEIVEAEKLV